MEKHISENIFTQFAESINDFTYAPAGIALAVVP